MSQSQEIRKFIDSVNYKEPKDKLAEVTETPDEKKIRVEMAEKTEKETLDKIREALQPGKRLGRKYKIIFERSGKESRIDNICRYIDEGVENGNVNPVFAETLKKIVSFKVRVDVETDFVVEDIKGANYVGFGKII